MMCDADALISTHQAINSSPIIHNEINHIFTLYSCTSRLFFGATFKWQQVIKWWWLNVRGTKSYKIIWKINKYINAIHCSIYHTIYKVFSSCPHFRSFFSPCFSFFRTAVFAHKTTHGGLMHDCDRIFSHKSEELLYILIYILHYFAAHPRMKWYKHIKGGIYIYVCI